MSADPIRGMEFLIVEDDQVLGPLLQRFIARILEKFPNSKVGYVTNFEAALASIADRAPDVVLLDLVLPPQSLEETISRLGEIEKLAPLVLVTGYPTKQIEKLMGERDFPIPIVEKELLFSQSGGFLFGIILSVITAWRSRKQSSEDKTLEENERRIREITEQLKCLTPPNLSNLE